MLEPLSNRARTGAVDDAPVVLLVQQLLERAVALKLLTCTLSRMSTITGCACALMASCVRWQPLPPS